MIKTVIVGLIALTLAGCGRLTYEEVQAQSKYCTDNGLKVAVAQNGFNEAISVRCIDSSGARYVPKGADE